MSSTDSGEDVEPILLTEPSDGTPPVVDDVETLIAACEALSAGHGAVAVDTERASGYRYWQKAYLIQLRRAGSGTFLVDPIGIEGSLDPLVDVLDGAEWVLHAASQDLPCLIELGMRPKRLFDTELAARLLGYERVALGTMVELLLGYRLEKGHSAADWSKRPLPVDWLNYAALDVELLLPLRDRLAAQLEDAGKTEWALEEFEAVRTAEPPAPRTEPWRRTSGIHKIRDPRRLAIVRARWEARDARARERDRAPGRVLPDSAIVAAAKAAPTTVDELRKLDVFGGRMQRKLSSMWLSHIDAARRLPRSELPVVSPPPDGPPPANRWSDRNPDAAARLQAARAALAELAERHDVPVENLLLPDTLRRICWEPPSGDIADALRERGARQWQVTLCADVLAAALATTSSHG